MRFLVFPLLALFSLIHSQISALNYEESSARFVKKINSTTSLTKESSDGDLTDCVDKTKQPYFDRPLWKDHKMKRGSKEFLKRNKELSKRNTNTPSQIWSRNGTRCSKGTVAIRRTTVGNVMRANYMSKFKKIRHDPRSGQTVPANHEHAIARYEPEGGVFGAKATINLWQPSVERGGQEYSSAQIRIMSGTNADFEVIEVGWHVYPWYYHVNDNDHNADGSTRFFIAWTTDSYQNICYNDECPGFVLQRNEVVLGGAFPDISSYGAEQYDFTVGIRLVSESRRWVLSYAEQDVGYWQEDVFTRLRTSGGTRVEFGGEVFNQRIQNRETSTQMGSGHFADRGYRYAAYFKKLRVFTVLTGETEPKWISPRSVTLVMTRPNCYTIENHTDIDGLGNGGFFYGGPGHGSPLCR